MKVDLIGPTHLKAVGEAARQAEAVGYDGYWTAETQRDPFLPLAVASQSTRRLELGTSIAVAFARNPMNLANLARDLQDGSDGRFILGLGSQIKPHITKRFSMPWSDPARRMRELILAMRAIWTSWDSGEKLRFKGDYYTHILMTPFFDPGPSGFAQPKVFLAGVGP
ncbi:MAG: LLM class flavin-dependent oxidoreductase, partial [Acidimicrobiales bacterium]